MRQSSTVKMPETHERAAFLFVITLQSRCFYFVLRGLIFSQFCSKVRQLQRYPGLHRCPDGYLDIFISNSFLFQSIQSLRNDSLFRSVFPQHSSEALSILRGSISQSTAMAFTSQFISPLPNASENTEVCH